MFNKKAQVFMYDFMFSMMVFLMIFAFAVSKYNSNIADTAREDARRDALSRAGNIIGALAESRGIPENWHTLSDDSIEMIGLAEKPLMLSNERLARFLSMDYNFAKELLGIQGYEFLLSLPDVNKGISPSNTSDVIILSRSIDYNGEITEMRFFLWSENT